MKRGNRFVRGPGLVGLVLGIIVLNIALVALPPVAAYAQTAALIAEVLGHMNSEDALGDVRRKVQKLTDRFPLYSWKLERAPAAS